MDKTRIAEHTILGILGTGIVAFIVFAALTLPSSIPLLGHAVLVPFNSLLTQNGVASSTPISDTASSTPTTGSKAKTIISTAIASINNKVAQVSKPKKQPTLVGPMPPEAPQQTQQATIINAQPQLQTTQTGEDLLVSILVSNSSYVKFNIVNTGGTTVPSGWVLAATLPSSYQYISPSQPALAPGKGFIYTLNINNSQQTQYTPTNNQPPCTVAPTTQLYYGTPYPFNQSNFCHNSSTQNPTTNYQTTTTQTIHGTFTVLVDPYNATNDTDRSNNVASAVI